MKGVITETTKTNHRNHEAQRYLPENVLTSGQITLVDSGLEFSGTPMWNENGRKLLVIGRKTEGASPEMRLLEIHNWAYEMIQPFDLKKGGRDFDWFVPSNN